MGARLIDAEEHRRRLRALADPTQLEILARLQIGAATAAEIAEILGLPPSLVRRRLRSLLRAEQVAALEKTSHDGRVENLYSASHRETTIDTDELGALPQDLIDRGRLTLLRAMFREAAAALAAGRFARHDDSAIIRFSVALDEQGFVEVLDLHRRHLAETIAEVGRAEARIAESGEPPIEASSFGLLFEFPLAGWPGSVAGPESRRRATSSSRPENAFAAYDTSLSWKIIDALTVRPASGGQLSALLDVPIERVRYELKRLLAKDFVRIFDTRLNRGATERIFAAQSRNLVVGSDEWSSRPASMESFVRDATSALFREALGTIAGPSSAGARFMRLPMAIDELGLTAISQLQIRLMERMIALRDRYLEGLDPDEPPAHLMVSGSMLFERAPDAGGADGRPGSPR